MDYPRSLINRWTHRTIASVIEVHKQLGPGLLESVYQRCLQRELTRVGITFQANHLWTSFIATRRSTPV